MSERRYNEKELAEILRRAGQRQFSGSADESGSFSLADIQRLAAEVGIEPSLVAAEASRLSDHPPERAGVWGASPRLIRDLTIPGQLSLESWEEIVAELRATFGGVGKDSSSDLTRGWSGGEFTGAHFTATRRGSETRLRLAVGQEGGRFVFWAMGLMLSFGLTMATGKWMLHNVSVQVTIAGILSVIALCLFTINRLMASWQSRNRRAMDRAMLSIERISAPASMGTLGENLTRARELTVNPTEATIHPTN